jgi:hypothetical protein
MQSHGTTFKVTTFKVPFRFSENYLTQKTRKTVVVAHQEMTAKNIGMDSRKKYQTVKSRDSK